MGHLRNGELGRYTTLKEVSAINNTTNEKIQKPTRIMKISEHTYRLFVGHSKRYYDVEDYDTILRNLIKDFETKNQDKSWRDIES